MKGKPKIIISVTSLQKFKTPSSRGMTDLLTPKETKQIDLCKQSYSGMNDSAIKLTKV